ncbi:MAG TPA: DNA-formamidopyrimidine glycosylase family protein [Candidatus Limnocylindrales bacterium]|jgi:endonuclease-8
MPEGDTLARIAHALRPVLAGKRIVAARGRPGGARLELVIGATVSSVEARGKHLLIGFDSGLTLHTHLGMNGSWHRYRADERWRRPAARAVAVLTTRDATAVCFDAPTVELLDTRALAAHPVLRAMGSDIATADFDLDAALAALREPRRAAMAVGDALIDQSALAGLGNVYRSELPFIERVNPLTRVSDVTAMQLRAMLERGAVLVRANSAGGARVTTPAGTPGNVHVYGRTGRPCPRCGSRIVSRATRARPESSPRRAYWCPSCQPLPRSAETPAGS